MIFFRKKKRETPLSKWGKGACGPQAAEVIREALAEKEDTTFVNVAPRKMSAAEKKTRREDLAKMIADRTIAIETRRREMAKRRPIEDSAVVEPEKETKKRTAKKPSK